jgi:hypothetical protein
MAVVANTLLDEVKCYACTGEIGMSQLLKLALLRRIALTNNPAADVTYQALIDSSECYLCLGISVYDALELGLLNIINGTP